MQTHDLSIKHSSALFTSGWSSSWLKVYVEYFGKLNEVSRAWTSRTPLITPVTLPHAVMPVERFLKTEFYHDGLRHEGETECGTGIKLMADGDRQATLAVQYGLRHADHMQAVLSQLLGSLGGRLRGALLANRNVLQKQTPRLNTELVHNLFDPALVLDQNRRVISANRLAHDLIGSSPSMRIGARDTFSFGRPELDAQFVRHAQDASRRANGSAGYTEFSFDHDGTQLQASMLPLSPNLHSFAAGLLPLFAPSAVVLLVLHRIEPARSEPLEFQYRYGLTNAELRIVRSLSKGGSVAKLADQLGIAYETARNQLKAAFAKTGTHSQRELLGLFIQDRQNEE